MRKPRAAPYKFAGLKGKAFHFGFTPYRNHWVEFSSDSKGIYCKFFPAHDRIDNSAVSQAHDIYIRSYNVYVRADQTGNISDANSLLQMEFLGEILWEYAPFVEAAKQEYMKRRNESSGPLKAMWKNRQKTVPAVGTLRRFIDELVSSGDVPKEAKGITKSDVIDACFKLGPNGQFIPLVMFKRKLEPKAPGRPWLAENHRCPHSDIGFAVTENGLHISLLSPKDGRERVQKSLWARRKIIQDHLDFQCGKEPVRLRIPMDMFLQPGFAQELWNMFKAMHIQLRTVALDASMLPNLPYEVRRATVQFHRWFRTRSMDSPFVYWKVPTLGLERRSCRDQFVHDKQVTTTFLSSIMSLAVVQCPRCWDSLPIMTDKNTGTPIPVSGSSIDCPHCHTGWDMGMLLADRARLESAYEWIPDE